MILDWYCACGVSGTAVALKRDEVAYRLSISHRYAVAKRIKSGHGRQNRCRGERIKHSVRAPAPRFEKG